MVVVVIDCGSHTLLSRLARWRHTILESNYFHLTSTQKEHANYHEKHSSAKVTYSFSLFVFTSDSVLQTVSFAA